MILNKVTDQYKIPYIFTGKEDDSKVQKVSTNFSIISVIVNNVKDGETIEIVVILSSDPVTLENMVSFQKEIY